jgi:hypothetical protein
VAGCAWQLESSPSIDQVDAVHPSIFQESKTPLCHENVILLLAFFYKPNQARPILSISKQFLFFLESKKK